jgi:hypothetical protein
MTHNVYYLGKNLLSSYTGRLRLILLLYVFLALTYALATPPLESSDEYKHYPFVQYLQTRGELPVLDPDDPGLWLQEAAQPPLYYLLMAAVTLPLDTSDLPDLHHLNEQAFIGNPNQIANKNLIVHDPEREAFPWRGSVLAIYLIRLASILLSVGTVWLTAVLLRRLFSPTVALLGAALTAFNPMFLFVSAAVNNDSLAILLGHAGLLVLLYIWQTAPDVRFGWIWYLLLGVVIGLGMLTKLSLGGLLLLTAVALIWLARWRGQPALFWAGGPIVLGASLLISGWWLVRNGLLYGDLTGLNVFIAVQGTRDAPLTMAGWLDEFGTFYRTFWGLFGGVNVPAPNWLYLVLNLLALVALAGLVKWLWQTTHFRRWLESGGWLLAAWSLILFVLLLRWNIISPAFQGRLLFPALGAINGLLAVGLLAWSNGRGSVFNKQYSVDTHRSPAVDYRSWFAVLVAGGFFLAAALLPWLVIRPVYALPEPLTAVPAQAAIDPVLFPTLNGELRLVAVEMATEQSVKLDDEPIVVTLYWQSALPVERDYISSVHLLGRGFQSEGQVDRYPASGLIPTSRWQAGDIYRDVYHVNVRETAVAPSQLRVAVSMYDPDTAQPLPAVTTDGQMLNPVLVGEPARLAATDTPTPESAVEELDVAFAEGTRLAGYRLQETAVAGQPLPFTIYWQVEAVPTRDYTIFVHLLDANREWTAGADGPPISNFYPTSLWQPSDRIDDHRLLTIPADLPAGHYPLLIGLYDPDNGQRLPRLDGQGDFAEILLEVSP